MLPKHVHNPDIASKPYLLLVFRYIWLLKKPIQFVGAPAEITVYQISAFSHHELVLRSAKLILHIKLIHLN